MDIKKVKTNINKFKQYIKKKLNIINKFIHSNVIEILFLLGCFFIVLSSFLVSVVLGFYMLGFILIILAILLLKPPIYRNKR